ncbi:MlaA family lipoprotein [Beggiatoa leptomitoformis]|uniref:VacJ family lipoprotein n=1 Tax=Beggiatoa leptomitoformis TaxID=288004 RepID=A0A2N9YHS0_9GAMM|nr:VacJ family lipoprotein [Beggiatoa leptomitoformis]ALG67664.1 VacJ family lipoprotein [Beggiatoa leptomitoformis]AUI70101.1 VacJ family lipoprotein [Beggiatoa leptomitoformis]
MLTAHIRPLSFSLSFATLCLAGCTGITTNDVDPYEPMNRKIYAFNQAIDDAVLRPVAMTYREITPTPLNQGISNVFSNIGDVVVVVNDVLQLKVPQAASDTMRLLFNSTIGIFGILDVGTTFGFPKHYEDFGQTLGYWGIGDGSYIVLPFFGPSSTRDTVGWVGDLALDPRWYVGNGDKTNGFIAVTNVVSAVDKRADLIGVEKVVDQGALDQYIYLRNAYLQSRRFLVYDGNPPKQESSEELDDLFSDIEDNKNEPKTSTPPSKK